MSRVFNQDHREETILESWQYYLGWVRRVKKNYFLNPDFIFL
jgi:hypothetical protein